MGSVFKQNIYSSSIGTVLPRASKIFNRIVPIVSSICIDWFTNVTGILFVLIFVSSSWSNMSKKAGFIVSIGFVFSCRNNSFGSCPSMSKLFPKNTYICPILFFPINLVTLNIGDNNDIIYK